LSTRKKNSKHFDAIQLIKDLFNEDDLTMKKIFMFSKSDYTEVYHDIIDNSNIFIRKLQELCNYSSAKMFDRMNNFRIEHCDEIDEIMDKDLMDEMDEEDQRYLSFSFLKHSLDLVIKYRQK
jgi:hypothetical protein